MTEEMREIIDREAAENDNEVDCYAMRVMDGNTEFPEYQMAKSKIDLRLEFDKKGFVDFSSVRASGSAIHPGYDQTVSYELLERLVSADDIQDHDFHDAYIATRGFQAEANFEEGDIEMER